MLHTCAVGLTKVLYRHCHLPARCEAVYIYGAELLFSTALAAFSILLISFLAGKLFFGILFILIFVSLRIFVGGYHASTYRNCFLLTNGVFLAALGASTLLDRLEAPILTLGLIPSISIVWMLAPIRNPHHPLSKEAYEKNKSVGRVLVCIESIVSVVADSFINQTGKSILPIASASIAAVAVMMIISKISERRGTCLG